MRSTVLALLLAGSFFLLFMPEAHAYIDPATGAMLLQALAAAAVAMLVFGKNIFLRIRNLFSPGKPGGEPASEETTGAAPVTETETAAENASEEK